MFDFWNILFIALALTGALCWACMIMLGIFIWFSEKRSNYE